MHFQIRNLFAFFGMVLFIISFVVTYYIFDLYQTTLALKQIEHQRYLMIQKANELRNSSDYLTRFARTHVVTQKSNFLGNYNSVLDIRNGIEKNIPMVLLWRKKRSIIVMR